MCTRKRGIDIERERERERQREVFTIFTCTFKMGQFHEVCLGQKDLKGTYTHTHTATHNSHNEEIITHSFYREHRPDYVIMNTQKHFSIN